jgi:hypothetical protein
MTRSPEQLCRACGEPIRNLPATWPGGVPMECDVCFYKFVHGAPKPTVSVASIRRAASRVQGGKATAKRRAE